MTKTRILNISDDWWKEILMKLGEKRRDWEVDVGGNVYFVEESDED